MAARGRRGLRSLVLRAGDFFGGEGRGVWFDLVVARDVAKGKVCYPGPSTRRTPGPTCRIWRRPSSRWRRATGR